MKRIAVIEEETKMNLVVGFIKEKVRRANEIDIVNLGEDQKQDFA